jgi:hypothetical protein
MSHPEIEEAVAAATGESLAVIHDRGFGVADPFDFTCDPEPRQPMVFDWDRMLPSEWPT